MKKINIIIGIIAVSVSLLFTSCFSFLAKETIKGNGVLTTKSVPISDFSKIEIETYVEVNYYQAPNAENLEFTIDENLWEYFDIHTKDDVLYIKLKDEYKRQVNLKTTQCMVVVSSEQLKSIDIAGSSIFNFCTPFTSKELDIELAGSNKVFANKYPVEIGDCKIDIAGSADVYLAGAIQKTKIEIAGNGKVKALECEIAQLNVEIAGSGNIEAQVTDKLSVEIAGSGEVKYKGDPVVSTNIAGSGKVIKL
jgi:uncharacterized protein YuzE